MDTKKYKKSVRIVFPQTLIGEEREPESKMSVSAFERMSLEYRGDKALNSLSIIK